MYNLHISILLSFIFTLALTTGVAASVTIENLKVEAQEKPLGIDISNPQFILKPTPDPDKVMTFAKGHYDSVYGTIKSEWRYQGDQLIYMVTIPANTSATLYLPTNNAKKVKESGKRLKPRNGISQLSMEDDQVKMNISSGEYRFEIK